MFSYHADLFRPASNAVFCWKIWRLCGVYTKILRNAHDQQCFCSNLFLAISLKSLCVICKLSKHRNARILQWRRLYYTAKKRSTRIMDFVLRERIAFKMFWLKLKRWITMKHLRTSMEVPVPATQCTNLLFFRKGQKLCMTVSIYVLLSIVKSLHN